ncbi:hypothetical protein FNU76_04105 [Chitinimonas arctica]|uniref:Secretion system X translation initiation factor n=1 Tax=Chitinimonas arctica TaxID=2594795 RepID=A0A516SBS7_9NEIS|nr:hypothetical protein [Chitinimonas arctica]QDQ25600.1 hypothetical protein FNU76_04105 [Chitinimonas arctica]
MTKRQLILLGLFCGAAYLAIWGNGNPAADAPAGRRAPDFSRPPAAKRTMAEPGRIAALIPRAQLMQPPQPGTNLFPVRPGATPPPPAQPVVLALVQAPVAPPLPFQFIGKKFEDGVWELYLDHAGQTLIVHRGDTLAGIYRVDEIQPANLLLTYLPLNTKQTLAIGQGEE